MDFLKKLSEGNQHQQQAPPQNEQKKDDNMVNNLLGQVFHSNQPAAQQQKPGNFGDQLNSMFGGGAKGEQSEDHLDKGIDWFQEHVLKEGQQSNESAIEQMKDKQIADFVKSAFKNATGRDIPGSKH